MPDSRPLYFMAILSFAVASLQGTVYCLVLLDDHAIFLDYNASHISASAGFMSVTYLVAACPPLTW